MDRTIDLIAILNQTIGANGLGTTALDINENENIKLSIHNIQPNTGSPRWHEGQIVYFGTADSRLDTISETLDNNLEAIQDDISNHISGLFGIITSKIEESDISEKQTAVNNAGNNQELESAINALLVSANNLNTALQEEIEIFFSFLDTMVFRIDEEVFNLLHNSATGYAENSLDQTKYFLTINNQSVIINSKEELFNTFLEKSLGETYTPEEKNTLTNQFFDSSFNDKRLKLNYDLINDLIASKGLSEEYLESFSSTKDFLNAVTKNELINIAKSFYGVGTDAEAREKLIQDHLDLSTPKYYEDERSLYDIVIGKEDANQASNFDSIFSSIGSQINKVTNSAAELLQTGYTINSKNKLQEILRAFPISGINYLEELKKDPLLSVAESQEVNKNLDILINQQKKALVYIIGQEKKLENPTNIDDLEQALTLLNNYDSNQRTQLNTHFNNFLNGKFSDNRSLPVIDDIDLETFSQQLQGRIALPKVYNALYANQVLESGRMNAEYDSRKLPQAKEDGSIPENTIIAPPQIGPSILSGVIAQIGKVFMEKVYNLESTAPIPTKSWIDDNLNLLNIINDQFSDPDNTAGKAFIESLKEKFGEVISDLLINNQDLEDTKNQFVDKKNLHNAIQNDMAFLEGQGIINNNTSVRDLENLAIDLSGVNYDQEITNRNNQITNLNSRIDILNSELENPELTEEERAAKQAQITALNTSIGIYNSQIGDLQRDKNILNSAERILSTKEDIRGNNLMNGVRNMTDKNFQDYKDSITTFSNKIESINLEDQELLKEALDLAELTIPGGDNIRVFSEIRGIINKIDTLSNEVRNIFGREDAVEGGIEKQSIRRLLLLLFVLAMFEASEWEYRRYEADTTRYQVV
jgi:hypothetical protein